jgi:hypothetical protein
MSGLDGPEARVRGQHAVIGSPRYLGAALAWCARCESVPISNALAKHVQLELIDWASAK